MKVKLQAQLTKVSSRSDRSYKLEFSTRELSGDHASILLNQLMNEGWLVYSPTDDIDDTDVPTEKANAGLGTKSPSQRLRAVLFVLWQNKGGNGSFEDYYRSKMEQVIETVKEKID